MNYMFLDSGYYENKHLEKLYILYITWNHNNTILTFDTKKKMGHQPKMEEMFCVENIEKYITTKFQHV